MNLFKSKLDCSDRKPEWYLNEKQKDIFGYYITQDSIHDFIKVHDSVPKSIEYGRYFRIYCYKKPKELNLSDLPIYYFYHFLANNYYALFGTYMGGDRVTSYMEKDQAVQDAFFVKSASAIDFMIRAGDQEAHDEPLLYPDVLDRKKNPFLNYLLSEGKSCWDADAQYAGWWTFDSWIKARINYIKIHLLLQEYVYDVWFQEKQDVSNESWMYRHGLYLQMGEDDSNKFPQPKPFKEMLAFCAKMVAYPEIWEEIVHSGKKLMQRLDKWEQEHLSKEDD